MRLLLAPGADRADVDALAVREGWRLATIFARTEARPRQLAFASASGAELVTYVEDHRIDARYLVLVGHDPSELAERICAALPCLSIDEVLAVPDPARRVAWLGVLAPERAAERIVEIVREALSSDDANVRRAARFAAEASGWPELREDAREGAEARASAAGPIASLVLEHDREPPALPLPERPRLSETVAARMHVADGTPKVMLLDWKTATTTELDLASWRVLQAADGTRDLDALCLALSGEGLYRGEAELVQLLSELSAVGLLHDGLLVPAEAPPVSVEATPADRQLEVLPGFTLVCDGGGSCCRFYGSVAFTQAEAARARAVAERMELPIAPRDLFAPASGAQEDEVLAVAQIDGRCAFLERDGRCRIHRDEGAEAKPFPCRFYPAMLIDDGEHVRVSLGPECACIFASVGREDGSPLVPRDARTLADLEDGVAVMRVPDPVPLTGHRTASRAELARWSRALVRELDAASTDAIAIAWTLAERVAGGLGELSLDGAAAPSPSAIGPWLRALASAAETAASTAESWRGGSDLSRTVARWIADALTVADVPLLLARAADPASERFYLKALAHGHRLAIEGRTLEIGLRDRATRVLAARAMSAIAPPADTSARYPLALLEAAMRNLGLVRYVDAAQSLGASSL